MLILQSLNCLLLISTSEIEFWNQREARDSDILSVCSHSYVNSDLKYPEKRSYFVWPASIIGFIGLDMTSA